MTPTEQQIDDDPFAKQICNLLDQKQEIESFTDNHRWLIEAVQVLLCAQLDLREELRKQRNHP